MLIPKVTPIPRRLEPVTRDPFIDGLEAPHRIHLGAMVASGPDLESAAQPALADRETALGARRRGRAAFRDGLERRAA